MSAATIYQNLIAAGLRPHQAAGFMGNFMEESTLKGGAFNRDEDAVGIAQWRGERKEALRAYATANSADPDDEGVQARFAVHEISTNPQYKRSWEMLQASRDPAEAARAVTTWEKPAGFDPKTFDVSAVPSINDRVQHANNFMNMGQSGQWGDSKVAQGQFPPANSPARVNPNPGEVQPSTLASFLSGQSTTGEPDSMESVNKGVGMMAEGMGQGRAAPAPLSVQSAEGLANSPDTSQLMAALLAKKKLAFMAQQGMA